MVTYVIFYLNLEMVLFFDHCPQKKIVYEVYWWTLSSFSYTTLGEIYKAEKRH